jgi:hypothetical protein
LFGRTPYAAWVSYVAPLREALRCITPGRFVLKETTTGLLVDTNYAVLLNNMNSMPLNRPNALHLIAGQNVRISERQLGTSGDRFQVRTLTYTYGFTNKTETREQELLTFHWNHVSTAPHSIPPGHLHVGRGLLAHPTVIRPGDFQNAHIPTGFIAFTARGALCDYRAWRGPAH